MNTLEIINLAGLSMVIAASVAYIAILSYDIWTDGKNNLLDKLADSVF